MSKSLTLVAQYLDGLAGQPIRVDSAGNADSSLCSEVARNLRELGCRNVLVFGIGFAWTRRLQINFDWISHV